MAHPEGEREGGERAGGRLARAPKSTMPILGRTRHLLDARRADVLAAVLNEALRRQHVPPQVQLPLAGHNEVPKRPAPQRGGRQCCGDEPWQPPAAPGRGSGSPVGVEGVRGFGGLTLAARSAVECWALYAWRQAGTYVRCARRRRRGPSSAQSGRCAPAASWRRRRIGRLPPGDGHTAASTPQTEEQDSRPLVCVYVCACKVQRGRC